MGEKAVSNLTEEKKNKQDGTENRAMHKEKQTECRILKNNGNTLNYGTHIHQ